MQTATKRLTGSAIIGSLLLLGSSGVAFAQTTVPPGSNVTDPPAVPSGTAPTIYDNGSSSGTGATNSAPTGTGMTNTTSTNTTTGATGVTPGIPNTGSGGNVPTNLMLLGLAALAVVGGAAYVMRGRIV